MLNDGGFHVRALDPASADGLRARVAGDSNGRHNSSRISGCGGSITVAGASAGGGSCHSGPWAGPEWQRGNPQEKRKIQLVQVPPADGDRSDGSYQDTDRDADAVTREADIRYSFEDKFTEGVNGSGGGAGGGKDPARFPAPARKARADSIGRLSNTKLDKREGEGGGGSWGYKAHGLGNILAFVARRRNGGDG